MKHLKITILVVILNFLFDNLFAQSFTKLDNIINEAIKDSIFPGAVVCVGDKDKIIYNKAYGNFTYDKDSPKVQLNTLFDLASVTKAFCITFCVMKLVDEDKLDIDEYVYKYLPDFKCNGKEKVKIIDLLIHESGLQSYYTPLKEESRDKILKTIVTLPLAYETNTESVYSCLNFVTMMMVIESIINKPVYEYYNTYFVNPLKMTRTFFNPKEELKNECSPTTPQLQGVVHDPLARALGGLSGNAGLFSTAEDMSKLCQLLLNEGTYNEKEYIDEGTIELFIERNSNSSSRALGFDTRTETGYSSTGKLFNPGTYGHLGYTGTSIWIDPVKEIFVIFFTNRVYPDDKATIREIRPKVHDAVMEALK
ncbi:MAG: serine hydrolase [Ignavibacteriales bacterium]|nr:serine hydrolase [Ignavibacteriales bacterium]